MITVYLSPDKAFYDVGIVVDNYKLNVYTKALGKEGAGYRVEIFPFSHNATTIKVMQVPKEAMDTLQQLINKLELNVKRSN